MSLEERYTEALGRPVYLRDANTSDPTVWDSTFVQRYHLPPPIPPPRTVLDLGANIGLTAAHYQALWPQARVVSVEMSRENIAVGAQNFAGEWLELAVAAETARRRYRSDVWQTNYTITGDEGDLEVQAVALDELIFRLFGGPVEFVKMDIIEGAEHELFDIADRWAPFVRQLLVEMHTDDEGVMTQRRVQLERAGFRVWRHQPHKWAFWAWH